GDLFSSALFAPFGGANGPPIPPVAAAGSNLLYLDESLLGLQAPANRYNILGVQEDDLDAVEVSDAKTVDDPADGMPDNTVGPPFRFVYFSLGPGSPSLSPVDPYPGLVAPAADPNGVTADDILVSHTGGAIGDFAIYARGVADIGLLPGDNLNSLVLWKTAPFDRLNPGPGADEALFTLSPGSPS